MDKLTKAEAAVFLGVTRVTLNSWIKKYSIPFQMLGRIYMFDRHDLREVKLKAIKWERLE